MAGIVRRTHGAKIEQGGSVISIKVDTIDGQTALFRIVPEAVPMFVAELVNGQTRAVLEAEGEVPASHGFGPGIMHRGIAASMVKTVRHPDGGDVLLQVLTEGGGVFEFVVPAKCLPKTML